MTSVHKVALMLTMTLIGVAALTLAAVEFERSVAYGRYFNYTRTAHPLAFWRPETLA